MWIKACIERYDAGTYIKLRFLRAVSDSVQCCNRQHRHRGRRNRRAG